MHCPHREIIQLRKIVIVCIMMCVPCHAHAMLSPVSPKPATSFSLPDIHGKSHSLEDYQGQWVLLHFWATWCGPCVQEFPRLNSLQQSISKDTLQVLAVAADSTTKQSLREFSQNHGSSLLVLHDKTGQVAAMYQATGLPITYLIDPNGNIVAVAKGAVQWDQPQILQALQQLHHDANQPQPNIADITKAQDIPIEAPQVHVDWQGHQVFTGQLFTMNIVLTWENKLLRLRLAPPELVLPEGIELVTLQVGSQARASRRGEIVYQATLKANETGTYKIDPIQVKYWAVDHGNEQYQRITGPTIVVASQWVHFMWPLIGVVALLLVTVVVVIFVRLQKGKKPKAVYSDDSHREALQSLLDSSERSRIDGDAAACLQHVCDLQERLHVASKRSRELLEKVQYGGYKVSSEDLKKLIRELELVINEKYPVGD